MKNECSRPIQACIRTAWLVNFTTPIIRHPATKSFIQWQKGQISQPHTQCHYNHSNMQSVTIPKQQHYIDINQLSKWLHIFIMSANYVTFTYLFLVYLNSLSIFYHKKSTKHTMCQRGVYYSSIKTYNKCRMLL